MDMCLPSTFILENHTWAEPGSIALFRTESMGFGVKALKPIPKGVIVTEYYGDLRSLLAPQYITKPGQKQPEWPTTHRIKLPGSTVCIDAYPLRPLDTDPHPELSVHEKRLGGFLNSAEHNNDNVSRQWTGPNPISSDPRSCCQLFLMTTRNIEKGEELKYEYLAYHGQRNTTVKGSSM
jgi:hypothetical protein